MRNRILIATIILAALLASAGCARGVKTQPSTLTPEQRLAIYKVGAQAAAASLAVRVASLEKDATTNADKIRILKAAKGFLDEFNVQVADVVSVDLTSRETIKKAARRGLDAADNLTAVDVLQLKDAAVQADIRAAIAVARSALASFDILFPAEPSK